MTRRQLLGVVPASVVMAEAAPRAIGRIRPRPSREIVSSRISIGFETLDREMFDPERCYPYLAQTGVKWARCQTGWARTERRKGEYDFSWLDRVVDALRGIGIQPWFNLGYGNTLYTPGPPHFTAVGWAPLNSDEARQAWVRYVERLAQRFAGRVKHWEIWNEPNIPGFWQPDKPDPVRYVELVRLTAPVLRKTIPDCVLIGGAFAGVPLDYMEGCLEAGLAELVDKISYHPYRPVPEHNYEAEVRSMRGLLNRYKSSLALWQGENGAPSASGGVGALADLEWDEVRQAKWLLRRLLLDLALGLELTSYFHTVDMVNYIRATGQTGQTNFKGVLRGHDYTPKASYYALQNLCALFDSDTVGADFALRVDSPRRDAEVAAVRTATFVRRGAPLGAVWYPADLQVGWQPKTVQVSMWTGKMAQLRRPVLADLLTGLVHPAEHEVRGGTVLFRDVPLRDYPVVLTDEAIVSA